MKGIMIYKPPESASPVTPFMEGQETKLQDKLVWQLYRLTKTPRPEPTCD